MNPYEEKLKQFLQANNIQAEHIHFDQSVHSVEDACKATSAQPDDFVKTICMIGAQGQTIAALVLGSYRASTTKVAQALNIERPNIASPEQALEKTGYQVGGTPPLGYEATFLIDPLVMEKEFVYVGGGAPSALVKISTKELQRVVNGTVARVRK
ncbi:MAG: YbaK/EbsC family protein [Parcubacteria group bacterium]|nr:YbaK/EbsC family protein [Parcubacteria group bacterium]